MDTNSNPNTRILKSGALAHHFTQEERIRGGMSKSPLKQLSSRLNGMSNKKDLTEEQKQIISLIKDKKFVDAVTELITLNIEDVNDPLRRDVAINQLTKLIPHKFLNINTNTGEKGITLRDIMNKINNLPNE